ncbi:hypothetical protein A5780_32685 [Nocardia sp. 852002-20019_SCH5090214]|nr:hypothetical protein A5780_32685 [Nocardia sp. 852002-20019_SCH5090214]
MSQHVSFRVPADHSAQLGRNHYPREVSEGNSVEIGQAAAETSGAAGEDGGVPLQQSRQFSNHGRVVSVHDQLT